MPVTVLPLNPESNSYQVFISIQDQEFSFSVHDVPRGDSSLCNAKLECGSELRSMLQGFEEVLLDRLQRSTNINALCAEVKDVLDHILRAQTTAAVPSRFYSQVMTQIDSIGWERIAYVADDFRKIDLRVFDSANREHLLHMELPQEYPQMEPSVSAKLPSLWSLEWSPRAGLSDALSQFQKVVEIYQDFWNTMEDLDKRAWVMEPEHPSHANTFRRLSLGGHCSLSVTINPHSPRSFPECKFFGPQSIISPLRKKMNDNIMKWTPEKLLLDNLEAVLESSIPGPQAHVADELQSTECGICYGYKLPQNTAEVGKDEGSEPDRVCDNVNCGRPFHTSCLVDWLHSLSTTRQSFNVLFGNCPYCSHPLAVKQ